MPLPCVLEVPLRSLSVNFTARILCDMPWSSETHIRGEGGLALQGAWGMTSYYGGSNTRRMDIELCLKEEAHDSGALSSDLHDWPNHSVRGAAPIRLGPVKGGFARGERDSCRRT